jgi:hypothetical protein
MLPVFAFLMPVSFAFIFQGQIETDSPDLYTLFSYPKAMESILAGSTRRMLGRGTIFTLGN